jgi:hypothetical protein
MKTYWVMYQGDGTECLNVLYIWKVKASTEEFAKKKIARTKKLKIEFLNAGEDLLDDRKEETKA